MRDQPFFPRHISRQVLRAPIKFLKTRLHFGVRNRLSERRDPIGGEAPVIVIAGAILPLVDFGIRGAMPGEKVNRLDDRAVKRSAHVQQDAVDVEDHKFWRKLHRISSMARNRRRVSARVPALMRMNPARGKSFRSRTRIRFRSSASTRPCARGPKSARTKLASLG